MGLEMRVILDIETDSLDAKVIYCIVCKDIDTGRVTSFTCEDDPYFTKFKEYINGASLIVGHYIVCFDVPVIRRLLGCNLSLSILCDTMVLSRLFNPVRDGGHSLENWGRILSSPKLDFKDFSEFTSEMLTYCIQDVELTYKVWCYLTTEGHKFSQESIELEHQVAMLIHKQKLDGFKLDVRKAHQLFVETKSRADELQEEITKDFLPKAQPIKVVTPKYTKEGTLSKVGLKFFSSDDVAGSFTWIKWQEFNLGSPKQVVSRLEGHWKPRLFTENMHPKVCEENFETILDTAPASIKKIGEYLMCTSRYKTISQWLDAADKNDRVHGDVLPIGTITHRMAHNNPNMGNITAVDKPYGKDMRGCWTVEDPVNYSLVGTDASGIQLRILAHYMNDQDYINEVVNGDIHTKNQQLAGIPTRNQAKTFIYAWLLGAGDAKVGTIIGGDTKDGREVKERFLKNLPSLAKLKERAARASVLGYMVALDGRHIPIKSEHYALSAYLQSGEALVMKKAMVLTWIKLGELGIRKHWKQVAMVHDEYQDEVLNEYAEIVGKTRVQCITDAGLLLKVRTPLTGEYRIGKNWCETH